MLTDGIVKKGDQCRVPCIGAWVDCEGSVGEQAKDHPLLEFRRRADAKQEEPATEPAKPVKVEVCHIGGDVDQYIMSSRDAVVNAIKVWQASGGNFLVLDDCVINMNTVENVSVLVDQV
jgi:hypothetical protein